MILDIDEHAALDRFLLGKTGRRWDAVPVPGIPIEALDAAALARFRRQATRSKRLGPDVLAEDDPGLVEKLRLTEGNYLKRAAILLFHPDPERFFTGAAVKIGYFASTSDLRYHDEVTGDLFAQVAKTMDLLLTKYLKAGISYEGIQRIESYPMPESALREIVLNAVIHRDYATPAPIQIRVYADRLLLWNPGRLPEGWTQAKLLGPHSSQPYNPDIANAFFRSGDIEAWGRGIQRVFEDCHQAETPEPRIWVEPGDMWTEFPFSAGYLESIGDSGHPRASTESAREATQSDRNRTREKILALIAEHPSITTAELAEQIDISTKGIEWQLAKLKAAGTLRRVGPDHGGHWEVLEAPP